MSLVVSVANNRRGKMRIYYVKNIDRNILNDLNNKINQLGKMIDNSYPYRQTSDMHSELMTKLNELINLRNRSIDNAISSEEKEQLLSQVDFLGESESYTVKLDPLVEEVIDNGFAVSDRYLKGYLKASV